jgi:hemolysin III
MQAGHERRYEAAELIADAAIHIAGTCAALAGAAVLFTVAWHERRNHSPWPVLVYAACLLAMLGCSSIYNLAPASPRRTFFQRLDHGTIFLMIAGTYTPFTVYDLPGRWAVPMTVSVWALACVGALTKLLYPRIIERIDLALYFTLGWVVLVIWRPLLAALGGFTFVLIGIGGALYSIGVAFHLWRALPFHKPIWHSFVLTAAGCHYAAVLHVALAGPALPPNWPDPNSAQGGSGGSTQSMSLLRARLIPAVYVYRADRHLVTMIAL